MSAIDQTALAIFIFEGGAHATSRNNRNANPGNLRPYRLDQAVDSGGYRTFESFILGWAALIQDIAAKVQELRDKTMLDLFNKYAPAADHNDPNGYAQFVCRWLSVALGKAVTVNSKIEETYA